MSRRVPKPLAPPTIRERADAAIAARALRAVLTGAPLGDEIAAHTDYSRPRRAEWVMTWANLPGFARVNGAYQHACLPGWQYTRAEVRTEMIPDLEQLVERGVRPTEATSGAAA